MAEQAPTVVRIPGKAVLVVTHLFPTTDRDIRGPWVAEQVDALGQLTDISVLCCSQAATNRVEVRPSNVRVTFRSTRTVLGHGRVGLVAASVRYDRALGAYLRSDPSIGLIHAHFGFPDAIVAERRARNAGLRLVVTLHGDDAFKVLRRRDPFGSALRRAVSAADAVICVSGAMADTVRRTLTSVDPIVITNGYDDRIFSVADVPRDLGLLFVGMLVPVKNLSTLFRAYARAGDRLPAPLTLAGDGPLRPDLTALAASLGIADRVRFIGAQRRDDVAALMRRASVLVLPSHSEGWPLVIAESLACGTPVIASRVGGIPEIVGSEHGGILVPPDDEAALADALIDMSGRSHDPLQVAAASRARPWSEQAKLIADVYGRILAEQTR